MKEQERTYMDKHFCSNCGLENTMPEFPCMHCGHNGTNKVNVHPPIPITDKGIESFVLEQLRKADGYIRSPFKCFLCGGSHYMIWPGKRSVEDYEKVNRLTALPQCPKRVWQYAKHEGMGMPLNKLLEELEAQ
jgi:hypothetical protein